MITNDAMLTRDQILGKAPITRKQLIAASIQAEEDVKTGRAIEVPQTYAEFRKVMGFDGRWVSYKTVRTGEKRLRRNYLPILKNEL